MQYYTTQQLQGHRTFSPKVRIGNWNEDLELHQEKYKDYLKAKEEGLLPHQIMQRKMDHHLQTISLTKVREGNYICFGDIVMLKSVETDCCVCMDLDMKLHHIHDRFGCTTSPHSTTPCARNCFVIEKVPNDRGMDLVLPEEEEQILHYGQKFRLRCVKEFFSPLYLKSEKQTLTNFAIGNSSANKSQEVSVDQQNTYDSYWKCQHLDIEYRVEFEGEKVEANKEIILTHCSSNQNLASHKQQTILNDFGKEYELFCKTLLNIHKVEEKANRFIIVQDNK
ncbi:hypothetical protein ABK040_010360 [Willaertia magna]